VTPIVLVPRRGRKDMTGDKSKPPQRPWIQAPGYSGPDRRVQPDRRKGHRRAAERRYAPRRLDERRSAGIGEVLDERRRTDRRRRDRRQYQRRRSDRRTPALGRRKTDGP
jgi:hypothetical protein